MHGADDDFLIVQIRFPLASELTVFQISICGTSDDELVINFEKRPKALNSIFESAARGLAVCSAVKSHEHLPNDGVFLIKT
jgi:hypothetical protein